MVGMISSSSLEDFARVVVVVVVSVSVVIVVVVVVVDKVVVVIVVVVALVTVVVVSVSVVVVSVLVVTVIEVDVPVVVVQPPRIAAYEMSHIEHSTSWLCVLAMLTYCPSAHRVTGVHSRSSSP
jgi:hypothetical protein